MKGLVPIQAILLGGFIAGVGLGSSGCQNGSPLKARVAPYRPQNVVTNTVALRYDLQRVLVLPVHFDGEFASRPDMQDLISQTLERELIKRGAFEPIMIDRSELQRVTGTASVRFDRPLPDTFLSALKEAFSSQGYLFVMVDHFQPYPPLTVAWRMKLVDSENLATIWEIDELFDSGHVAVAEAAREHYGTHQSGGAQRDERLVLHSPRRFVQYTSAAVLQTLPY